MKKDIMEFMENVKKIAQEHLQEEEKLKENFQNTFKEILSNIKSERKKLVERQKETEAELKRIHIQINLKKQQYNKSMQDSDTEQQKKSERELLELAEKERVLALRKDTLSEITGCDNEHTRKLFDELYTLYTKTKNEEMVIHGHYKEILEELKSLKETLEREIEKIGRINKIYDMSGYNGGIERTYAQHDVVEAFEIIHGEAREPWKWSEKIHDIDNTMAQKRNGRFKQH